MQYQIIESAKLLFILSALAFVQTFLVLDSFEFPSLCSFLGRKISGEKKEKSQKIIPEIFAGTGVRTEKLKIDRGRLKSI